MPPGTPTDPDSDSVTLHYIADQLGALRAVPPSCLAHLGGDFNTDDTVTAVVIQRDGVATCDATSIDDEPGYTSLNIVATLPRGMILIRIDKNFGGSETLSRYLVVSLVDRIHLAGSAQQKFTERLVLAHLLLPIETATDEDALTACKDIKIVRP